MRVRQQLQADHIWNFLNRGIAISYAIFSSFDEYLDHFDASRDILNSSFFLYILITISPKCATFFFVKSPDFVFFPYKME
jgi:hypothetical protein